MLKMFKISTISVIGLIFAFSVFAQNYSAPGFAQNSRMPASTAGSDECLGGAVGCPPDATLKNKMRDTKQDMQQDRKDIRNNMKADVKTIREKPREEIKEIRENKKEEIKEMKEEFKERVKEKREELKDRIEVKREELKEQLKKIKDERKKQVVEKIDKRLDELNERMVNHFMNILDRLEDVLTRISERADKFEDRGINVSSVRVAIDTAQKAINNARTAVEAQADKTYKVEIDVEDRLRADVGKARQALHADLAVVRKLIGDTKNAVHDAARTLAQTVKTNKPSVSSNPSPTLTETPEANSLPSSDEGESEEE